jgi:hypothetical protein
MASTGFETTNFSLVAECLNQRILVYYVHIQTCNGNIYIDINLVTSCLIKLLQLIKLQYDIQLSKCCSILKACYRTPQRMGKANLCWPFMYFPHISCYSIT